MEIKHLTAANEWLLHVPALFSISWILGLTALVLAYFAQAFFPELEYLCCEY